MRFISQWKIYFLRKLRKTVFFDSFWAKSPFWLHRLQKVLFRFWIFMKFYSRKKFEKSKFSWHMFRKTGQKMCNLTLFQWKLHWEKTLNFQNNLFSMFEAFFRRRILCWIWKCYSFNVKKFVSARKIGKHYKCDLDYENSQA